MTAHRIRTSVTDEGFAASCCCGYHTVRPTRDARDHDVRVHRGDTPSGGTEATARRRRH